MKKHIKNNLFLALLAGLIFTTFPACKKYPNGPAISFHSRAERVANTWIVDSHTINGIDYTALVADHTETFTKEGVYSFSYGIFDGTGRWAFQNNDTEIRITGISSKSSETLYILKLKEREFWYYYMDGGDRKEFHMIER